MRTCEFSEYAEQLGPDGPGYVVLPRHIPDEITDLIRLDMADPSHTWLPQDNTETRRNGESVKQHYEYLAHKLTAPDQSFIDRYTGVRKLGDLVAGSVIKPLSENMIGLDDWRPTALYIQRYPALNGGIGWHYDAQRYQGVIVIANPIGQATIGVVDDRDQYERAAYLNEADILVIRGHNLRQNPRLDPTEHAVLSTSDGRISISYRMNVLNHLEERGVIFHNWSAEEAVPA